MITSMSGGVSLMLGLIRACVVEQRYEWLASHRHVGYCGGAPFIQKLHMSKSIGSERKFF